ncbi:MAG: hypothetical protein ABI898_03370 [Sphingomonadales bacterium]
MKKLIQTMVMASVATVGFASTPVMAQGYYPQDRDGYYQVDNRYDNRGYDNRRGYDDRRSYDDRRGYNNNRNYNRNYQQCRQSSGTTGTILGAIAGGLLGREIGRGGYGNRPSTTGLIVGGGLGALAGRAIDKNSSCDNNRYR